MQNEALHSSMATSEFQNPSSSSPNPVGRYDIFLSFRGLDTRKKFTDHLYHALKRERFETFRDDDEIDRGSVIKPELHKAIMNSRMSVIVLSRNYTNSTACLFELQTILELCKKSDHFALPVFYEVDPWEIMEQSKNLDFGKKEVAAEKVEGWSAALKEVGSMAGMVSGKESDGTFSCEAEFIEEIVCVLKSKLAHKYRSVDNYLVDMRLRTERVNCWLKDRSCGVGILLICGMGGIGKTTIAKVVYNSNQNRYDAACFLENIRGVSKGHKGLVHLQRQLLSEILGKNERINNVDDGRWRIKYALSNKRVLLVLDDVDQTEQLFALAGQQDWFSPGSKIIITTRLESVMENADESYDVYWPEKLSDFHSLRLFSWHAFRRECPNQSHMALSKRFVQYCDGLPLALQVLGSSCREKSIDVWESDLRKLQAYSDSTILKKLELSYDSLNSNHDKNLFLEIACFFVGKKKKETITILESCDYLALAGIHNLIDKNLLTIKDEKLQMHQLLQDMGKNIACSESYYPEDRSRIWSSKESFVILSEKVGTNKITGLVLDMDILGNSDKVVFEATTFENMYNLRLLKLSGVTLSGSYKAFPKRLRWLYWSDFPSESFPNDFPLENLVALDMRDSNLKRVWKGTKVLGALKILNLSYSLKLAKTPKFSTIPNLEKLILKGCPSLFELDESIVELQRLESLNLQDCKNLRKLPRTIGMVESLMEIDISGCSNLSGAMEELEKMKSLQVLKASGMDIIDRVLTMELVSQAPIWPWVPKPGVQMSLATLPCSLVHLNISNCKLTDDAFPRDLSKLAKLQRLLLCINPISSLPNFIEDLADLQTLDLSFCQKLEQIRWSSSILDHLLVVNCNALKEITLETGTRIRDINCFLCWNLNHVQNDFKFLPVKEVDVELLNSIGFFNLDSMADAEANIVIGFSFVALKLPIQIYYRENVFSTFFPGREVPPWFSIKNSGSTISFTATLFPHFGFRGLNLCLVYTLPNDDENGGTKYMYPYGFVIHNKSSGITTMYQPNILGIPEDDGDMVWLSHCCQANMFLEGDEVEIKFRINRAGRIKECGVHLLYFREEGQVSQYVDTIHHSWDSSLSLYLPGTEAEAAEATAGLLGGISTQNSTQDIMQGSLELSRKAKELMAAAEQIFSTVSSYIIYGNQT